MTEMDLRAVSGMRVTVMGLGLNGGGLESARFFARGGAMVTVTDLRGAETLAPSIRALEGLPVRYVLGRHEEADFRGADLVIKNPGVPPASAYLKAARDQGVPVETDLSVFLRLAANPLLAVTGSKGKSTTASAVHHGLRTRFPDARLAGNITVSPLSFLEGLDPGVPVVLELSSWQLGDLAGRGLLRPRISVMTRILPDHQDRYPGMTEYVADKKAVFREQEAGSFAVFNRDDPWQAGFPPETSAAPMFFSAVRLPEGVRGAWLEGPEGYSNAVDGAGDREPILPAAVELRGEHNRMNLLCAGLCLRLFGVEAKDVRAALADFTGVEHRLERVTTWRGIRFYNDSAATIPHATAAAVRALDRPVVLIAGGTDKNLDFSPLLEAARIPERILLLSGTATEKIRPLLEERGIPYDGPYAGMREAVAAARDAALRLAASAGVASVVLSPGCASFGMFLNEFDRGRKYKEAVAEATANLG